MFLTVAVRQVGGVLADKRGHRLHSIVILLAAEITFRWIQVTCLFGNDLSGI